MNKIFKILCLSRNAKLIKSLDEISNLQVINTITECEEFIKHNYHFVIFDQYNLSQIFQDKIEAINLFLYKMKDQCLHDSYFLIFSDVDYFKHFLKNSTIDDFISNPFSEYMLQIRLELLYNKRFWQKDSENNFNYKDEIDILLNEISVSLNRIQIYFYNVSEGTNYIKKDPNDDKLKVPSGFLVNIKKIQIILRIIYVMISNNINIQDFNHILELVKEILSIYNVPFSINFNENFSFSALKNKKNICLAIILSLLTGITEIDFLEYNIEIQDNNINISINKNILKNSLFSSIILEHISKKGHWQISENNIIIFN